MARHCILVRLTVVHMRRPEELEHVCPPPYTLTIKKTVSYWRRLDRVPFFLFCSWQLRLSRLQGFKLQIMDVQYFWRCVFRSESLYISPLIVPLLSSSATLHFYVVCLLCQEKRRPTQNIVRQTTVRAGNVTQVDWSNLPNQIQTAVLRCNVVLGSRESVVVLHVDLWPTWPYQIPSLHLLLIWLFHQSLDLFHVFTW